MFDKWNRNGSVTAIWHMQDVNGQEDFPYEIQPLGDVTFEALQANELEDSLQRGSDGHVVVLREGCLSLNNYRARKLHSHSGSFTLYIRAKIDADDHGCLFYSDFTALAVHKGGFVVAFLGVRTHSGKVYREIPLCHIELGSWLDLILQVGAGQIRLISNGVIMASYLLCQELCSPFADDMVIGGMRFPIPDTYGTVGPRHCFRCCLIDTVAIWDSLLTNDKLAYMCGVQSITEMQLPEAELIAYAAYNSFFDASVDGDIAKCSKLWVQMQKIAVQDPRRPAYHLTQPIGHIFDPAGAYYHNGEYHVFSYRNLSYLLHFSSLDHYVSKDLVNWSGYPIGPFADDVTDVFCIYLMNHFVDDKGHTRVLYTGQGYEGKNGILAYSDDKLITYTDKHTVLNQYHHDGHVFKHGDTWYTITSKMCKGKRAGKLGDALMLWSSKDLDTWVEEAEIFSAKKTDESPDGFMEFPYLLNFGEKDVLLMGTRPVQYWVGHMDWHLKRFIPDNPDGKRIDYANPFPCCNPMCVDNKGEGGSSRRMVMTLYRDVHSHEGAILPWHGTHALVRQLSLIDDHLCQDPISSIEMLRMEKTLSITHTLKESEFCEVGDIGNCTEVCVRFTVPPCGTVIMAVGSGEKTIRLTYDAEQDDIAIDGAVDNKGHGPVYAHVGEELMMRIFFDKVLFEAYINGQTIMTSTDVLRKSDNLLTIACNNLSAPLACQVEAWNLSPAFQPETQQNEG